MRERLGRVQALLQATPLPADLVDDPTRTGQWLIALGNLNQAVALLRPQPQTPPGQNLAAPTAYETRSERVIHAFQQMIEGLPLACLGNLSPVIKLGLIWPLLKDLDAVERRLRALPAMDISAFSVWLTQYRRNATAVALRHVAPDPPDSGPPLRPAASIPVP